MADAGARPASADKSAALIRADEMVFIDNPPKAVPNPLEHSTPGVSGEPSRRRERPLGSRRRVVTPSLAAPPSRGP